MNFDIDLIIKQVVDNTKNDRQSAKNLFDEILYHLKKEGIKKVGPIHVPLLTKLIETQQKSNEQLIKIINIYFKFMDSTEVEEEEEFDFYEEMSKQKDELETIRIKALGD